MLGELSFKEGNVVRLNVVDYFIPGTNNSEC
jgi:hypothetical protein